MRLLLNTNDTGLRVTKVDIIVLSVLTEVGMVFFGTQIKMLCKAESLHVTSQAERYICGEYLFLQNILLLICPVPLLLYDIILFIHIT